MKDWVRNFLLRLPDERISKEELEREVSVPIFCFRRLCRLFNVNWKNERLTEIFGGVVADLDESVFLQLLNLRNFFIFFTESLAMVQGLNFIGDRPGIICVLSRDILALSDMEIRGTLIHELCHVLCGHHNGEKQGLERSTADKEIEADQKAISMGFEYEISKIREHLKNQERRKRNGRD